MFSVRENRFSGYQEQILNKAQNFACFNKTFNFSDTKFGFYVVVIISSAP